MDQDNNKIIPKKLFPGFKARYNVASWKAKTGHTFVIFRQIKRRGKHGEPDFTKLILTEFDEYMNPLNERIAWEPKSESLLLEDPRAFVRADESVVLGLTALLRGSGGSYIPYPAITRLETNEWRDVLPAITIVETFGAGKNTTPIESDTFLFRPERSTHNLLLFSFRNFIPKKEQLIHFPKKLPWASYRIGTAMPPLWIDANHALLIFHGISIRNDKYIYSLGRAGLIKDNGRYKVNVKRQPLMDPDFFRDDKGKRLAKELHPNMRRVVYCCGGILKPQDENTLMLFVNVGDTSTFQVDFSVSELTKDLF